MRWSALLAALFAAGALAHGEGKDDAKRAISGEEFAFGRQGDPRRATRIIRVTMADSMRYSPSRLTIRRGETVKFLVRNRGKLMHEMVIGTLEELRAHAELMKMHPETEHEDGHIAHVVPGRSGILVWQFTRAGEFHYGCLVPGHFEAGMVGRIIVK